jgi:uncharacterized protein (DUF433 family)
MVVRDLVAPIVVSDVAPEEMARRYGLPVQAVQGALDYYRANQGWIDAETDEVGRELGLK